MVQGIPWPAASTADELSRFLFAALESTTAGMSDDQLKAAKKARVRAEQLRWHPDKVYMLCAVALHNDMVSV